MVLFGNVILKVHSSCSNNCCALAPPCALQWGETPTVCSQNAWDHHRPPGWEAGAAAGWDVHPHRRERPEDWSGHQEKLPPQLQHRQRCVYKIHTPVLSFCTDLFFPISDLYLKHYLLYICLLYQVCYTELSASSSSTAKRSCSYNRGLTPKSLFQVSSKSLMWRMLHNKGSKH